MRHTQSSRNRSKNGIQTRQKKRTVVHLKSEKITLKARKSTSEERTAKIKKNISKIK